MKDVFLDFNLPDKPILICGKGPSLDSLSPEAFEDYFTIGLNQVHKFCPVDYSFFIHSHDIKSGEHLIGENAIIPYYPHNRKSVGPLSNYQNAYHYNLCTAPEFYNDSPIIYQDGFTIHALLNCLGLLGVKEVFTAGIDGGQGYASKFKDLTTNCKDFDLQFRGINDIAEKFGMSILAIKPDTAGALATADNE